MSKARHQSQRSLSSVSKKDTGLCSDKQVSIFLRDPYAWMCPYIGTKYCCMRCSSQFLRHLKRVCIFNKGPQKVITLLKQQVNGRTNGIRQFSVRCCTAVYKCQCLMNARSCLPFWFYATGSRPSNCVRCLWLRTVSLSLVFSMVSNEEGFSTALF